MADGRGSVKSNEVFSIANGRWDDGRGSVDFREVFHIRKEKLSMTDMSMVGHQPIQKNVWSFKRIDRWPMRERI
jgi:hypothetical protein